MIHKLFKQNGNEKVDEKWTNYLIKKNEWMNEWMD